MASHADIITVVTSFLLRLGSYIFLRWIPASGIPGPFYALLSVYVVSFVLSFVSTSPYKILSDEIEVIAFDKAPQNSDGRLVDEHTDDRDDDDRDDEVLDVQETVLVEEDDSPKILRTLLTGLPSPTSVFWSLATLAINLALAAMVTDLLFRAPILYEAHDLSFARVGYVSEHSANILIREPRAEELPIFLSYRYAGEPQPVHVGLRGIDTSWKSAGSIDWLSDDTDFTAALTIKHLRPETRYQYALSNNHTGYFSTAPNVGQIPKRNDDKYSFLHSSCILPRFPYTPFSHPLHVPGFKHLAKWIPKLKAHLMLFLGDFIYADVPMRMGTDAETYRRQYRQVYASPDWPAVSKDLAWVHVLDDHEISNDWDRNTTGIYNTAIGAWSSYQASVNPTPVREGQTYYAFMQGPASFFLMDTRRFRSPEFVLNASHPEKTMLGNEQLHDLLKFLHAPTPPGVRWKFVISSVPFTKNWHFGEVDTWAGYLAERRRILEAMWDVGLRGGVGVVVLSGDRHEFAATSFPPPKGSKWPLSSTVHEFSASPLNMFYLPRRTYAQRDDEDVCIKYIPDGNSKFGAVEITSPSSSDQSLLRYRLFVDGEEGWSHTISTPPNVPGSGRAKDALWG